MNLLPRRDLVILGAGGVGRQVAQIVADINSVSATWNLIGYLDDDASEMNDDVAGVPILGDLGWLRSRGNVHVVVAIGRSRSRFRVYRRLERMQHQKIATLIHPSVWLPGRATIGTASIVYAGTMLDPDIVIGEGCIVNKGCTIGHDTDVGNYASLAPGVNLGGAVRIGCGCYFGIGSATIQGLSIGRWSVIGAGAVVIRDLPANVTAVGVPAEVIETRQDGWHLP